MESVNDTYICSIQPYWIRFSFVSSAFYLLQIVQISSVVEPVTRSYISYTSVSDGKPEQIEVYMKANRREVNNN
jgi:hypothetical protein